MEQSALSYLRKIADELLWLADHVDLNPGSCSAAVAKTATSLYWGLLAISDLLEHPTELCEPANPQDAWLFDAVSGACRLCSSLTKPGPGDHPSGDQLRSAARAIRAELDKRQGNSPGSAHAAAINGAQQAQREKIFPLGRDGISQDTIDVALDIFDSCEDTPQIRMALARKHFEGFADCKERASKALKDLRARKSAGRISLQTKRNRRNGK